MCRAGCTTLLQDLPRAQGFITPLNRVFSNKYYQNILLGNAFFQSDHALGNSPLTRPCVEAYSADNKMFFRNFTCVCRAPQCASQGTCTSSICIHVADTFLSLCTASLPSTRGQQDPSGSPARTAGRSRRRRLSRGSSPAARWPHLQPVSRPVQYGLTVIPWKRNSAVLSFAQSRPPCHALSDFVSEGGILYAARDGQPLPTCACESMPCSAPRPATRILGCTAYCPSPVLSQQARAAGARTFR